MAEAFLRLSAQDRLDALGVAADRSGRPTHQLEKDVWVVWALAALYGSPLGERLVFKGGTSLSKAYRVIRRFSEDVDLTYDIRAIVGSIGPIPIVANVAKVRLPTTLATATFRTVWSRKRRVDKRTFLLAARPDPNRKLVVGCGIGGLGPKGVSLR